MIDQEFLDRHRIDYVAHDEMPYEGSQPGQSDIYRFIKDLGKFLPTRRTDGVWPKFVYVQFVFTPDVSPKQQLWSRDSIVHIRLRAIF